MRRKGWLKREVNYDLGNVRPEQVKKIARVLVELFPNKFTTNFENNKKLVESFAKIPSTKLRNRIAGYITRLLARSVGSQVTE